MFNFFRTKKLRLICFDLDNTLCDFDSSQTETEVYISDILSKKTGRKNIDILRAFNEVKKEHIHHDSDPKKYSRRLWIEETLQKLDFIKNKNMQIDAKKLEDEYWNYLDSRIKLFPNTLSTLCYLHSLRKKYKIVCITDSDGEKNIKNERIKALGLNKYFDYIITSDDTGKNKPAIENWEYIAHLSKFNAEECMMVGDHPDVDLINAKKLGFVTVWTKEHIPTDIHFKFVDYEIRDISEVLKILEKY